MANLFELFESLPLPQTDDEPHFSAIPIPRYENHRLGKNSLGMPLLLISTSNFTKQDHPAPIVLEHLKVLHQIDCHISRPDGIIEQGVFTIVQCIARDANLHQYFLRIVSSVLLSLRNIPTQDEITYAVNQLVELFRAIAQPARKSIQGLWAELFIMARTKNTAELVSAWHSKPDDLYDFSASSQRLEIKSTAHQIRQHFFSLEQLNPPAGIEVLVASVIVENNQAGKTINDLSEKILSHINNKPDLVLHFERIMGLSLGNTWYRASEERFDEKRAEQALKFFNVSDIASVNPNLPREVSCVRFKSDLTNIPSIEKSQYHRKSGLFLTIL